MPAAWRCSEHRQCSVQTNGEEAQCWLQPLPSCSETDKKSHEITWKSQYKDALTQILWTRHFQCPQKKRSLSCMHFQQVVRNTECGNGKETKVHSLTTTLPHAGQLRHCWCSRFFLSAVLCLFYLGCQFLEAVTSFLSSGTHGCAASSKVVPSSHVILWFAWDANDFDLSTLWRCAPLDTHQQEHFFQALHCSILNQQSLSNS